MERVDGHRSNSSLYVFNGHIYYANKARGQTSYFDCRSRETCPARVVLRNGLPVITQGHNHDEDLAEIQLLHLKTVLRRRARTENTAIETIFREEERRYPEAARLIAGLSSLRSTMFRSRQLGTPRIPATLVEYAEIIRQRQWFQRYGTDLSPNENPFFREYIVSGDGSVNVIFASHVITEYARDNGPLHLHMDATFKVVPRAGGALQLFSIHLLYDDKTFPMLYSLMERKSRAAYEAVFRQFRQLLPNAVITSIMADYETAMRLAAVTVFPRVQLRGCWFHLARAVFKKSQELGLQRRDRREIWRPIVRAAMTLPLLPRNLLANGIDVLEELAVERNVDPNAFIQYLRRQWLPLQISVHGEYHRTNNSVESFHRELYRFMERPHPNIWTFTERLKAVEHAKSNDFVRLRDGVVLPRQRRRRYIILDQRIRRAEERLAIDNNVRRFLLYVSHGVAHLERVLNRVPVDNADVIPPPNAALQIIPPIPAAIIPPAANRAPNNVDRGLPPDPAPVIPPVAAIPVGDDGPEIPPPDAGPAVAVRRPDDDPVAAIPAGDDGPGIPPPDAGPAVAVRRPDDDPVAAIPAGDNGPGIPPPDAALPTCITCLVAPRTYLLLDCRHLCLCAVCVRQFRRRLGVRDDNPQTRCPLCRTPILHDPILVII